MASTVNRARADQWSNSVTPVFAAITTLCSATALSGVIDGSIWIGHVAIAIIVVAGAGIALRAIRFPILLIGIAQLLALACLVVALFTTEGILGFLPGPKAIDQLGEVLRSAITVIQTGVPPVEPTTPVLCLVVIAIGLVAVLVDALAVAAATPAASGLVLLCVYAVPASLADDMLPWWSFVLGAGSYALLLYVDGQHRHQVWRGRSSKSSGSSVGAPVALVGAAMVLALVLGGTFTFIGTVGQLPGNTGGGSSGSGFQLQGFTELRGMLQKKGNQEMFRVRGQLDEHRYLRATTLKTYVPNQGWVGQPAMPAGNPLNGDLPLEPGRSGGGPESKIVIEPVKSVDFWAPVIGSPRRIDGINGDGHFDEASGSVYAHRARTFPPYTEYADLSQPTYAQLRASSSASGEVSQDYLNLPPLNPRITQLARQLTAGKGSQWEKVVALKEYFAPSNGFSYRNQTAEKSDQDALVDFLFNGKVGFCEQYASAMAVLARAAGIPARVALGFTSGFQMSDYRSVTTQDAHAWVEVFFPQYGWITVDPTPLSDGRAYTPPYMNPQTSAQPNKPDGGQSSTQSSTADDTETKADKDKADSGSDQQATDEGPSYDPWVVWAIGGVGGMALVLTLPLLMVVRRPRGKPWPPWLAMVAASLWSVAIVMAVGIWVSWWLAVPVGLVALALMPAFARVFRRRDRLHAVASRSMTAAEAAWQELLAESWDRGATIPDTDTVRMTARRLVREHSLDDQGREGLRTVVGVLERSWYGGGRDVDPSLPGAVEQVRDSMRRNAPMALRAKLMPRSVLRPQKRRRSMDD
jgi:hypothetical protein